MSEVETEGISRLIGVVSDPIDTAVNDGISKFADDHAFGKYKLAAKPRVIIKGDQAVVMMIFVDPVGRMGVPITVGSPVKSLPHLLSVDSIDLIEDAKGEATGVIGYSKGQKIFSIGKDGKISPPSDITMFFNLNPAPRSSAVSVFIKGGPFRNSRRL